MSSERLPLPGRKRQRQLRHLDHELSVRLTQVVRVLPEQLELHGVALRELVAVPVQLERDLALLAVEQAVLPARYQRCLALVDVVEAGGELAIAARRGDRRLHQREAEQREALLDLLAVAGGSTALVRGRRAARVVAEDLVERLRGRRVAAAGLDLLRLGACELERARVDLRPAGCLERAAGLDRGRAGLRERADRSRR